MVTALLHSDIKQYSDSYHVFEVPTHMSREKAAFEWGAQGSGCVGSREKYTSGLQRKEKIF